MNFTTSHREPPDPKLTEGLTNQQRAVMAALDWWDREWARPLDLGGRSGSHHSGTLAALERKELVESRQRSGYLHRRGSKVYRLTEKGRPVADACDYEQDSIILNRLAKLGDKA